MIGIIGAMPVEVDGLTAILNEKQGEAVSGIVFYQGKISGVSCVVACCGPGKVNAAVCTQAMLMRYPVSLVINTGVAGGIGAGAATGWAGVALGGGGGAAAATGALGAAGAAGNAGAGATPEAVKTGDAPAG